MLSRQSQRLANSLSEDGNVTLPIKLSINYKPSSQLNVMHYDQNCNTMMLVLSLVPLLSA